MKPLLGLLVLLRMGVQGRLDGVDNHLIAWVLMLLLDRDIARFKRKDERMLFFD
jgi:hypothetical protein